MKNKKNLLVTISDQKYIEQAKQLFSSVYFNSGWKGDYMLLYQDILPKDLKWFKEKEILLKECKPILNKSWKRFPPSVLNRLYLFKIEFKKWDKIIYLDADIIVRGSLNKILDCKGFGAVRESSWVIKDYFYKPKNLSDKILIDKLKRKYLFNKKTFNCGFFIFNSNIIKSSTFDELIKLLKKYFQLMVLPTQILLNIYFYNNWKSLPFVYNLSPYIFHEKYPKINYLNGIIIHSVDKIKFWNKQNFHYSEWRVNYLNSSKINLNNRKKGIIWSIRKIKSISLYYLFLHKIYFTSDNLLYFIEKMDKLLGKLGVYFKKKFPFLYYFLIGIKKFIR